MKREQALSLFTGDFLRAVLLTVIHYDLEVDLHDK
jgi:hypothetical protein